MPRARGLGTGFGHSNTSSNSARNASRLEATPETRRPKSKVASKVKGKAACLFTPTRPEYANSFGVQLGNLHGRCRWDITGRVADLWPGSLRIGLRDTIQEALARPEENIYKGFSIRHAAVLHCYMVGYNQECAHPTIAICHPIAEFLARSVKLVSGMVKLVRHGVYWNGVSRELIWSSTTSRL